MGITLLQAKLGGEEQMMDILATQLLDFINRNFLASEFIPVSCDYS